MTVSGRFPLTTDNQVTNPSATALLIIEQGGQFSVTGQGIVLGDVQTELAPGEQQKYILVKKSFTGNNPLDLDLATLKPTTDKANYSLKLEQENEGGTGYLYGVLTYDDTPQPDPSHKTIPWTPLAPAYSTRDPSSAKTFQSNAFSQQLPVNMVDQILASRLLYDSLSTSFCKKSNRSAWIGQCLDETDEPFSLWALPLYDHITGRNFDVPGGHIGFRANIRGLGLQLVKENSWGSIGAGLFNGKGDINSTELYSPCG